MGAITSPATAPPVVARRGFRVNRIALLALAGLILLAILVMIHLRQGTARIDDADILHALFTPDGSIRDRVVRYSRLPRVTAGLLVGAALAMSGVLMQAATRNPLASASTVGVNAGANLALVAATLYAPALAAWSSPLVAFGGGLIAATVVYLLAAGSDTTPTRLALAGMALTIALGAVTTILTIFNEYTVAGLYFWGAGSLIQRNWQALDGTWYWIVGLGMLTTLTMSRGLDVMELGDDVAASLGQRVARMRLGAMAAGVLLAALAVSIAGAIGFVGLVAPHLVRLAGVRRHRWLLPLASLWGAIIVVGADVMGRWFSGPMDEVPAGLFTVLIGGPWLIWLARRAGGGVAREESGAGDPRGRHGRSGPLVWGVTVAILLVAIVCGLALGDQFRSFATLWEVITGRASDLTTGFVVDLRLPRVLVAGMVGAALAVSGLLTQGVVRNPLAAPDLIGVSPGASVGAVAVLIALPDAPAALLPFAAFGGAVIAFGLVYMLSWSRGVAPARLALVGVAVAAFAGAITTLMVVRAAFSMTSALTWLAGSTYARDWGDVRLLAPCLLVLLPLAWVFARWLDVMALGDDATRALGMPMERARLALLAVAVALAALAVSVAGAIAFVGLIAPHVSRMLLPNHHRRLVPHTALLGAVMLIVADTIGRAALPPTEIPSGLITALIGTPYFLWLLSRSRAVTR